MARDEVGLKLIDVDASSLQATVGLGARSRADIVIGEQAIGVLDFAVEEIQASVLHDRAQQVVIDVLGEFRRL